MHPLIHAPSNPSQWDSWRDQLHTWRSSTRALLNYDDSRYAQPAFGWIPRAFTLGFVMMCDLLFYDGDYQLDAYLAHGEREFGGYDALLLWQAYPRIGFDDRSQFAFYRQMPGSFDRLRELVNTCHARGIHVYVAYSPWDTGTRRTERTEFAELVKLLRSINADAVFLDTMANAARDMRVKIDALRPGVTFESEVLMPLEQIDTHLSSWAQGFADAPGVLRNKWFERRHMQHRVERWQRDHSAELHTAWMNGSGMIVWENVFGSYHGWSERDKSILRGMVGIQRRYAALFSGEGWTPLIPTLSPDIYASLWEDSETRLWTLVNSSETDISADLIAVPHHVGDHYYDLLRGVEVTPSINGGLATLSGTIRSRGVGAFLVQPAAPPDLAEFLRAQAALDARANFDPTPPQVVQILRPAPLTMRYARAEIPANMAALPRFNDEIEVSFTVRECGFYDVPNVPELDLRYKHLHRRSSIWRQAHIPSPYALDLTPVTNAQFAQFLAASGYQPADDANFLAHWRHGEIPPELDDHPVVYVSLDDARAYAAWAGKRLPTEDEWQFAAAGSDGLPYPWGWDWLPDHCNTAQYGARLSVKPHTTSVTRFPQGRSHLTFYDLCGNVWEWTESERSDGRTRFVLLKGGSFYRAYGSEWYADGGAQTNQFAAKFLLMSPGLDRCATIGFRCAVDLVG